MTTPDTTYNIGQINILFGGLGLKADTLASMGIHPIDTNRAAKLYSTKSVVELGHKLSLRAMKVAFGQKPQQDRHINIDQLAHTANELVQRQIDTSCWVASVKCQMAFQAIRDDIDHCFAQHRDAIAQIDLDLLASPERALTQQLAETRSAHSVLTWAVGVAA